jgi:hypothetical protein
VTRRSRRPPTADEGFQEENYAVLNRAYYGAEPADYFEQRLFNLFLTAGNPEGRAQLLRKGVSFGKLSFTRTPDDEEDPGVNTRAAERFVLTEVKVLVHHVAETLLRLYFGHQGHPRCPQLEIARIRTSELQGFGAGAVRGLSVRRRGQSPRSLSHLPLDRRSLPRHASAADRPLVGECLRTSRASCATLQPRSSRRRTSTTPQSMVWR